MRARTQVQSCEMINPAPTHQHGAALHDQQVGLRPDKRGQGAGNGAYQRSVVWVGVQSAPGRRWKRCQGRPSPTEEIRADLRRFVLMRSRAPPRWGHNNRDAIAVGCFLRIVHRLRFGPTMQSSHGRAAAARSRHNRRKEERQEGSGERAADVQGVQRA
ncbi:unnamed protein product [Prorocentrum cordatum]|uniref:Uncharacterized protein n=1 Tax=Prorocentrum cordatum TaxID=2364126 RepID=A0ABN9PZB8_9DINO|nr:unnamed protein product [Polarella glacialis]